MKQVILLFFAILLFGQASFSQEKEVVVSVDSSKTVTAIVDSTDSLHPVKRIRSYIPRVAAIRSAILPGLGQIYNKKYWKLPIVYGALGTTGAIFAYNLKWYKRTRYAFRLVTLKDTQNYNTIHSEIRFLAERGDAAQLGYLRQQYRRDIDYSALFFMLFWGLNVVDATVDAHLKSFDVSPDLSLKFKPGYSDMANTAGLNLVLEIGKNSRAPKLLPSFRD